MLVWLDSLRRVIAWPQSAVSLLVFGGMVVFVAVATWVMDHDGCDDERNGNHDE